MDMAFTNQLEIAMQHFCTSGGFLTVKSQNGVNTMTVSWGFIGFMWNKPHFITVVRPQRYTKQFLDDSQSFTISIPFGTMKEQLAVCGSQSGRDVDKSTIVDFVPGKTVDGFVVKGCNLYYECNIKYVDEFSKSQLSDELLRFYKEDYHHIFYGEIVDSYSGE